MKDWIEIALECVAVLVLVCGVTILRCIMVLLAKIVLILNIGGVNDVKSHD